MRWVQSEVAGHLIVRAYIVRRGGTALRLALQKPAPGTTHSSAFHVGIGTILQANILARYQKEWETRSLSHLELVDSTFDSSLDCRVRYSSHAYLHCQRSERSPK
jgi:hypothetical protein